MEQATSPPAARLPVAWYSWWLMPVALGAGTAATAVAGPDPVRIPAALAGTAATAAGAICVRLLLSTRSRLLRATQEMRGARAEQTRTFEARLAEQARAHDARIAEQAAAHETGIAARTQAWQEQLAVQVAVVGRLGDTYLPGALERLRDGEAIDDILPDVARETDASPELRAGLRKILRTALIGVEAEFDRSTSAEQAVISIGSRMQVLTSKLRGRLHEMQGEHGRLPAVARGLMELDQEIGPADRLAASIGVLGGSDRPGRQWQEPQRLLSVVRGGIGRIKDFERVRVRRLPELGVDGALVDHLTLIFAHLLDNAARYSPPTEAVLVSGREVPNGVGVEIQDAGKGLSEEKKQEAARVLAGEAPGPGLGGIAEDANLGLRVVGTLARRYGIRVTFADSPWLGTSVVVVVPHKYFSPLPATVTDPVPGPGSAAAPGATDPKGAEEPDTTPGGLPRRRGGRTGAAPARSGSGAPSATGAPAEPRPEDTSRAAASRPGAAAGTEESVAAVPPAASFAGLAAFATAGRESGPAHGTAAGHESDEHRTEESD
ncbi:ATP-binding protein [Streptomyces sp. NPDC007074]|uniref:ATP-binding protein n=1 Tax=Streptomyces sp. NPDC007074 TaxID=3156764 RepID=UPI0033F12D42